MKKIRKKLKFYTIDVLKRLLLLLGVRTVEREGVFVIIRNPSNPDEILLVQHQMDGKWSLPGGGIKHKETAIEGIRREALDETGLIISPEPTPIAHLSFEIRYGFILLFQAQIIGGKIRMSGNNNDIRACQFFSVNRLPLMYNAQKGMVGWAEHHRDRCQPSVFYGHPNKPPIGKYSTP